VSGFKSVFDVRPVALAPVALAPVALASVSCR